MNALTFDNRNLHDFEAWQHDRIDAMKRRIADLTDQLAKAEYRLYLAESMIESMRGDA